MNESILVLDFGSQTAQLIVRRIRELGVYSELLPHDVAGHEAMARAPRGIVLSGGPASVYAADAPALPRWLLDAGLPVLGICYGMQLQAHALGGTVEGLQHREFGPASLHVDGASALFADTPDEQLVWMSHGDQIARLPEGFVTLARSPGAPHAAAGDERRRWYGMQFHPEVRHTTHGGTILRNFIYRICGCTGGWRAEHVVDDAIARVRAQIGPRHAICGLSGGVDSAVAALLVHHAIGDRLTCVFVDNGLLRRGEARQVVETFREHLRVPLVVVDAAARFLDALAGITDPEQKRIIIGEHFIRVFEREARRLIADDERPFLVQGTLYPDVIESRAPDRQRGVTIKTHHNVGGLPADMQLSLVEPLRYLFKDEVRAAGSHLGLPDAWVWRHPFPGPGLAVRVLGAITTERLETLRAADACCGRCAASA